MSSERSQSVADDSMADMTNFCIDTTKYIWKPLPDSPAKDLLDAISARRLDDATRLIRSSGDVTAEAVARAVADNDVDTVSRIATILDDDSILYKYMHTAFEFDATDVLRYLITLRGGDSSIIEWYLMMAVVRRKNAAVVYALCDMERVEVTEEMLHFAVFHGDLDVVECLLAQPSFAATVDYDRMIDLAAPVSSVIDLLVATRDRVRSAV